MWFFNRRVSYADTLNRGENPVGVRSGTLCEVMSDLLKEVYNDSVVEHFNLHHELLTSIGTIAEINSSGLSTTRCPYCGTRATHARLNVSGLCEHCGGPL